MKQTIKSWLYDVLFVEDAPHERTQTITSIQHALEGKDNFSREKEIIQKKSKRSKDQHILFKKEQGMKMFSEPEEKEHLSIMAALKKCYK